MSSAEKINRVVVREATAWDVVRLGRLMSDWCEGSVAEAPPPTPLDMVTWALTLVREGKVWVAQHETTRGRPNRIVGVLALGRQVLPGNTKRVILKDQFIFVSNGMKNQGVGEALMVKALGFAASAQIPYFAGTSAGSASINLSEFSKTHSAVDMGKGLYAFGTKEENHESRVTGN